MNNIGGAHAWRITACTSPTYRLAVLQDAHEDGDGGPREPDGIRRYVHLDTGNYNCAHPREYTDVGLFNSRSPSIGADVSDLFQLAHRGISRQRLYPEAPRRRRRARSASSS